MINNISRDTFVVHWHTMVGDVSARGGYCIIVAHGKRMARQKLREQLEVWSNEKLKIDRVEAV